MLDQRQWTLGILKLQSLKAKIPTSLSVARVDEYHEILRLLESGSGEDLSTFRIPDTEMKPRVSWSRMGIGSRPGHTEYSKEKYADKGYFERQIDTVSRYVQKLESIQSNTPKSESKDYWSLSDGDLEALASKYNIQGYGYANMRTAPSIGTSSSRLSYGGTMQSGLAIRSRLIRPSTSIQ
jgi:hypothetical protein